MKPFKASKQAVHVRRNTRKDYLELQIQSKERIRELLADSTLVPRELVILGRAMNIVRANNKTHGSVVNRVSIMADMAATGSDRFQDKQVRRHPEITRGFASPL